MSQTYKPMLAKEASEPSFNKDWIYEIKWDGFRAIAYVNKELSLRSRNSRELKGNFPELEELNELTRNVVLDGEIVVMKEGKADFQSLLERGKAVSASGIEIQAKKLPATYVIFDILEKDGNSLVKLPLTERKKILRESVKDGKHVVVLDFVEEKGEDYYKIALEKGIEGIVAKKKDSVYEPGIRSENWLKIKKLRSCDCVIFGYTRGTGARAKTFGALILGLYDEKELPVFVGKVGTGFSDETLAMLLEKFQKLRIKQAPFETDVHEEITWLKPRLACEVIYQVVTNDGRLRMPRFRGLRKDKNPSECTLDQIFSGDLSEYRKKRDFTVTAEPAGENKKSQKGIFVVQEHHARRLHYDLRLESKGVLKSWAVPKGIPETPEQKRLAVQTEDHPIEYAAFEGTIPQGQYGAGTVKIWDKGDFLPKVWDENMVEFTLNGKKLLGRYVLVRLKKAGEKSWLLLKGKE